MLAGTLAWIAGNRSASAAKISRVKSSKSVAMSLSIGGFARGAASSISWREISGVLVFVEVRARSGCHFGTPFESVTWQKRQRLCKMAASYLCLKRLAGEPCRFDVVSILERQGERTIELVRGAFDMESLQR